MVAYTPNYCLPFFECSDSPCTTLGTTCEPESVWCSAMTKVEAALSAVDSVIARTASAVPLAQVSITYATATDVLGEIPFNVVDIDTDDMVNLSAFSGVTVNRSGVYLIHSWVLLSPIVANDFPDIRVRIGNESSPGQGGVNFLGPFRSTSRGFGTAQWVQTSGHWQFDTTGPTPPQVSVIANSLDSNVLEAHLMVAWHSDPV